MSILPICPVCGTKHTLDVNVVQEIRIADLTCSQLCAQTIAEQLEH